MTNRKKERQSKARLVTPTSKTRVSNAQLLKMLKRRQIPLSELTKRGVTEYQLTKLRKLNYKITEQYDPKYDDIVYYALEKGDDPFVILPDNGSDTLKIAKMSDIHLGSNEIDEEELISLLAYLWKSGYRILTLSGNIVDGFNVYRGHIQNISYATLDAQADLVTSILSLFDFLYITNTGNHDASSTKNSGVDVVRLIEQKMLNRGKKFVYLKSYSGYIVYKDAAIQIIHMEGGGNSISETYAGQKLMDNIFKTSYKSGNSNVNYVKIMNKMVPVVNVITGHYHALAKFTYGNVVVESPLTTQHTTDFVNRRGLHSKTGARVSEMRIESGKCISEKGAIIFGRDVNELYDLDNANIIEDYANTSPQYVNNRKKRSSKNKEIDVAKVNKALKVLIRKGYMNKDELGLTKDEIEYINETCNYNIYVKNEMVVFKSDDDNTAIIYSPIPQKGLITYLEISNLLVGSVFFSEKALRYMLDKAKEAGIKHVHIGGNAVWGIPNKNDAEKTLYFSGIQQAQELTKILKDYPMFHYFTINGYCENSFIRSKDEEQRFNPMEYIEKELTSMKIKFTAIHSSKCDFLIDGIVFRMVNDKKALKNPYTRDYDIIKAQRALMAKQGNITRINGKEYNIGAIFYGYVPNTFESHSGGIYVTSTGGPTIDKDNMSRVVQSNAECAIVRTLVDHGEIIKFEREVISPNV